jgi:hypothetical protein
VVLERVSTGPRRTAIDRQPSVATWVAVVERIASRTARAVAPSFRTWPTTGTGAVRPKLLQKRQFQATSVALL